MKKLIALLLFVSSFALAQTYPSPTYKNLTVNGTVSLPTASVPPTVISGLGAGVSAGLTANVNSSPNGFAGYNLMLTTGAGITPQMFGAAGNGSTDDTTALQNWLNASASAGQPAFCSTGTYKITKTLNVTATAIVIQGPLGSNCAITPSFPTGATVSGAAAGATYSSIPSIRLTVSTTVNMGAAIEAFGIAGTTEANGAWPAVVIDGTHVDIVGPTFAHAWTSGGTIALPVIAINPTTAGTAAQPNIDLSGVYFAPPSTNAAATDVAIVTGPPSGSNAVLHDFVANGYRRGVMFYNSFAPIIKNAYFYNHLGAAIVANQDISFSNARVDHVEFFSNGNTNNEAATIIGGANWVENPTFLNSQWSGNYGGLLLAGNVNGATIQGNYLENNTNYNLSCGGGANNNGAHIVGNWFSYNSGTNATSNGACTNVFFSGNWLNDQTFTWGAGAMTLGTNTLTGTGALNFPTSPWASLQSSSLSLAGNSSNQALTNYYYNNAAQWQLGQQNGATPSFFLYNSTYNSGAGVNTFSVNPTSDVVTFGHSALNPGDTSSNATPGGTTGYIGEVQAVSASAQAITSATATNIVSKSIPAGHWACYGSSYTSPAGSTVQTLNAVALNTVSAALPTNAPGQTIMGATQSAGVSVGQNVGPVYYNFTAATTVYLVGFVTYSASTLTVNGTMQCQRIF